MDGIFVDDKKYKNIFGTENTFILECETSYYLRTYLHIRTSIDFGATPSFIEINELFFFCEKTFTTNVVPSLR